MSVLRERGFDARVVDQGGRAVITRDGRSATWRIRRTRRTPRPSEFASTTEELLWTPTMTPALRDRLLSLDVSWVTDGDEIHIRTPWGLIASSPERVAPVDGEHRGPSFSPGALMTLQYLVESPTPITQVAIARAIGLSQPRASQVLKELVPAGLALRQAEGWIVSDPGRGFDSWLSARQRLDLITEHWYSLLPARDQIRRLVERAEADEVSLRLCGDWAADVIAPWRRPGAIVVHADASIDLEPVDFVAGDPTGSTVIVHIGPLRPRWMLDERVFQTMGVHQFGIPLAPVTEIAREILAVGGTDAAEAVAELRQLWLAARARVQAVA